MLADPVLLTRLASGSIIRGLEAMLRTLGERTASDVKKPVSESDENGLAVSEGIGEDETERVNVSKRMNRLWVDIVAGKGVGGREGEGAEEEGGRPDHRSDVDVLIYPVRICEEVRSIDVVPAQKQAHPGVSVRPSEDLSCPCDLVLTLLAQREPSPANTSLWSQG